MILLRLAIDFKRPNNFEKQINADCKNLKDYNFCNSWKDAGQIDKAAF